MVVKTVTEAKASLSALLARVDRGEEVIIGRGGKPIAILSRYCGDNRKRIPGRLRGRVHIAPDFDDLPPELAKGFCMERQ